jgi:hypothetical protein
VLVATEGVSVACVGAVVLRVGDRVLLVGACVGVPEVGVIVVGVIVVGLVVGVSLGQYLGKFLCASV